MVGGLAEDPADADGVEPLGRGCVVLWNGGTRAGGVADEPGDGGPANPGGGGCEAEDAGTDGVVVNEPPEAEPAGAACCAAGRRPAGETADEPVGRGCVVV